nr:hypothetical protein BaRGS_028582 [Batillaria attramentaria]
MERIVAKEPCITSVPGTSRVTGYRSDVALDHDERSWAREPFGEYPYHVRHTSAYPDGPTPYHPVQYPMDRESHLARGGRYMSAPRLWLSHYPEDPVGRVIIPKSQTYCPRSHSNSLSSDSDNAMSAARGRQTHGAPSGDERTPEVDIRDIKTDNETRRKRPVLSAATCARKESVRRLPVVCAADMAVHRGNESRRSRGEKHKMGCACEICKANRPCRGGARVGAASDRVEGDVVLETRMGPNDREIPPGETVVTDPHRVELRRGEGSDRRGDSEGRVSSGHSAGIEQMGVLLNPTSDTSVVNSENQHCSSFTENGHSTSPKAPHGPRGQ